MNDSIFYFFFGFAHRSEFVDTAIKFLAVDFPYVVMILAGIFLLFHHDVFRAESPVQVFLKKKKEILSVFATSGLAWVLAFVLKSLFATERPFVLLSQVDPLLRESGYAFPSGHATFFSALAFSIFFLHKNIGYCFMLFALVIGVARIMLGVHFPGDILGGFVLGALVAYAVAYFGKMYKMR